MEQIRTLLMTRRFGYVVTPNAQHINILQKDEEFKKIYDEAGLVLADGMSIVFASRILGCSLKEKCSGADMFHSVLALAAEMDRNLFILGGADGSEKEAVIKANRLYPHLNIRSYCPEPGFEHDPKESASILQKIAAHQTAVLFICVGSPKSEKWIYRNRESLAGCLAFSLGDALNFFAGVKKRAPKWMRDSGLEWVYRLAQEPHRLWRRYLVGNIKFGWIFARELRQKWDRKPESSS